MSKVKEAIEEMIEESYLLGLSEDEIRRDFSHFIDTCYTVIHAHVRDRAAVSGLAEDLAREKTCILIADRTQAAQVIDSTEEPAQETGQEPGEAFAERVARRKRLILKTIGEYDPQLVRLIDEQRFQADFSEIRRPRFKLRRQHDWERYRLLVLKLGYATTVVLIILLIYLGFAQKP